jgi:hypothetical protein
MDRLPPDLCWQSDGHATDVVLAALADGEAAIVPDEVTRHLDECADCTARLGAEAMLTAQVSEWLAVLPAQARAMTPVAEEEAPRLVHAPRGGEEKVEVGGKAKVAVPERKALPKRAVGAALLVAALGALPAFVHGARGLPEAAMTVRQVLPVLIRGAMVTSRSSAFTVVLWASAVVLVMAGLGLARMRSSNGDSLQQHEGGV